MLICHIKELKMRVKASSNHSITALVIPDSSARLLEGEEVTLCNETLCPNFSNCQGITMRNHHLRSSPEAKVFNWAL